jgi:hypothetical protein
VRIPGNTEMTAGWGVDTGVSEVVRTAGIETAGLTD